MEIQALIVFALYSLKVQVFQEDFICPDNCTDNAKNINAVQTDGHVFQKTYQWGQSKKTTDYIQVLLLI